MSRRILKPRANICQLCDHMITQNSLTRQQFQPQRFVYPTHGFSAGRRISYQRPLNTKVANARLDAAVSYSTASRSQQVNGKHATDIELEQALGEVKQTCNSLLASKGIPSEADILYVLETCEQMAKLLVADRLVPSKPKKDGAASALLSLDESDSKISSHENLPGHVKRMLDELSESAYAIVKFPPVFISPQVLEMYVNMQALAGRPETLPEILLLFASKPLPEEGSSPIKYRKQNPNKAANAIPLAVADRALQTAIVTKNLVAAMDIIEMSYCTKAAHRAKFIRKGLLPATGLAVAPFAAYTLASQLSLLQTTMDNAMATQVAFAGILAYVGLTATVGVVAVTTANDQMDRVTWAQGVPLRQRWIREEERAAIDKVAGAWGFREIWRRGEEEGEDWDTIREWIGRRAMMLDRVELMEGME